MENKETNLFFNQHQASSYDERWINLAPLKEALHLCLKALFSELPADSRVLCVGAGTGAELISLAQAYPEWNFTVVEPSLDMMNICRQRAESHGIAPRCSFHQGYVNTLPGTDLFNAATSILVSHFIVDTQERMAFFSEIAKRLRPGGYLINADLASDMSSPEYKSLIDAWIVLHQYAGITLNVDYLGRDVALLPTKDIQSILVSSGLSNPVLFYQNLLIHAWYSRVE
ncbi:MAG TPA: class I SAM-dependent methyltransferase [Noviherbaspirillum sp.]|nr:class I SAM-dependent methyltransferase [Noviherbaspirillum sp.]